MDISGGKKYPVQGSLSQECHYVKNEGEVQKSPRCSGVNCIETSYLMILSMTNALRDPLGRVGRSLGTVGLDTGSRGLGMGRGITRARYWASVLGNGTKI